ncbi:cold shock domain-containing protein C2-like [Lytechinus pictus]|uniref:cold shock domain-containing protein C2-like n=1 Tax=Lytechinus pictus TaxID=7653 RepID=UPI0030B9E6CA
MSEAQASAPPGSPEKTSPSKQHAKLPFLVPSPVPCRRTRTTSMSRIASEGPIKTGVITEFERSKGHGFIKPDDRDSTIFVHISDIEGEYVICAGDRVEFRECPLPPKMTEKQAVEVMLTQLNPSSKHERWNSAE